MGFEDSRKTFYPVDSPSPRSYLLWAEYALALVFFVYFFCDSARRSFRHWRWWLSEQLTVALWHLLSLAVLACAAALLIRRDRLPWFKDLTIMHYQIDPVWLAVAIMGLTILTISVIRCCCKRCCRRSVRAAFWPWLFWSLSFIAVPLLALVTWKWGPYMLQWTVLLLSIAFFVATPITILYHAFCMARHNFSEIGHDHCFIFCAFLCFVFIFIIVVVVAAILVPSIRDAWSNEELLALRIASYAAIVFWPVGLAFQVLQPLKRVGNRRSSSDFNLFVGNRRSDADGTPLLPIDEPVENSVKHRRQCLSVLALRLGSLLLMAYCLLLVVILLDQKDVQQYMPAFWTHLHQVASHSWREFWCC